MDYLSGGHRCGSGLPDFTLGNLLKVGKENSDLINSD
jgi:hypothetical protein